MTDLDTALALMRQGRPEQAAEACASILAVDPDHFGARHVLGITYLMRGDAASAEREISRAVAIDGSVAGAHYNHGNALVALDRLDEALASYDQAIALKPDFAEAHRNRGDACALLARDEDAIASWRDAVEFDPTFVETANRMGELQMRLGRAAAALESFDHVVRRDLNHLVGVNNLAGALYVLERYEEALAAYEHAIRLAPRVAALHDNRGLALSALRRYEDAVASHTRAIALEPALGIAHHRRAMALRMLKRFDEALVDTEKAIALMPGSALALNGRGVVLNDLGRYDDAIGVYRDAIAASPDFAEAHNNLGNALHDLGRMEEALLALDRAIALRPMYAEAFANRGMVLQDTRRLDDALVAYDTAIASRPAYAEGWKRRASLRLLQGDYLQGWADYDTSLAHARRVSPRRPLADAYWEGQALQGKSLLLSEPNGFGDTLQFWRFIPQLLAMGARISFLGQPRMFHLLRSSPWPVRLLGQVPAGEQFDYECELWSLPRLLRTTLETLPDITPYLTPEPGLVEKWAKWLGRGHVNIGIAWQGKPDRKIDAGRSIPLSAFRPLAGVAGVRLISLQKGEGVEQLRRLPDGMQVEVPGPDFDTGPYAFADTAALMASLDLVVSSDTAIAHLAGALERPVWVALKHVPEWRWMLDRSDSPWYPTMRLFRQEQPGDWSGPFEAMAAMLRHLPRP